MEMLITGASGFIGQAASRYFSQQGWRIWRLSRQADLADAHTLTWHPQDGRIPDLPAVDAVLHLAGENIFGIWTEEKKERIRDSRVQSTALLAEALARLSVKPTVFLSASAIGYYGDQDETLLTEAAPVGGSFLSSVCRQWEAAATPAQQAGIRTVFLRFGMVLDPAGGALAKMIKQFRYGLGGTLGSGQQWLSWITLADALAAIAFLIRQPALTGGVNLTTPHPVRQQDFAAALAAALHRPAIAPMPATILKMLLGEMAQEVLLASIRAMPEKLTQAGFVFDWPDLPAALTAMLQPSE